MWSTEWHIFSSRFLFHWGVGKTVLISQYASEIRVSLHAPPAYIVFRTIRESAATHSKGFPIENCIVTILSLNEWWLGDWKVVLKMRQGKWENDGATKIKFLLAFYSLSHLQSRFTNVLLGSGLYIRNVCASIIDELEIHLQRTKITNLQNCRVLGWVSVRFCRNYKRMHSSITDVIVLKNCTGCLSIAW